MRLFEKNNLKYLIIFLIPILVTLFFVTRVDNDSWFVLAEGREIVENGVYKTDMLSMHSDFNVVVQNYGFAVLFWLTYAAFGLYGLYVGMLLCLIAVEVLLYKIFMLLSEKNEMISLVLMTVVSVGLAMGFVVTRAQMASYVIFLTLIYLLEKYARSGRIKYLYAIPFLSLIQINLHASLWLMLFLVMGVFVLDASKGDYKAKPIIITGLIAAAMGLLSPYGIEMITFVLKSYFGGIISNLVDEMKPFSLTNWRFALMYGAIAIAITLGFYGNKKDLKTRYLLLFIGFLAVGINTLKGMSQVLLVMFLPVAAMYKEARWPETKDEKKVKILGIGRTVLVVVMLGMLCRGLAVDLRGLKEGPDADMVAAVDKLDEEIPEEKRKEMRVYTGYNDGGYMEFRGYRPYLDPRAEVFLESNNGKEDVLLEWMNVKDGEEKRKEFLKKYNFDYIVVRGEGDPLYRDKIDGYEVLYRSEDDLTRVLKRV